MKLYGKTVRLNKKRGFMFSRGASLTIVITMRCHLKCSYCPLFVSDEQGKKANRPVFKESTVEEWKAFIIKFPEFVSQFDFSGGEPSCYEGLAELVNWIIETTKSHVVIYSNLFNYDELRKLKPHWRLRIKAVMHFEDDGVRFYRNYRILNVDGFNIDISEIEGSPKRIVESKIIHKFSEQEIRDFKLFHVSPDRRLFLGCHELHKAGRL